MTTSMSPCLYAGEPRMEGIQAWRNWSAAVRPPTWPPVLLGPAQVASCPSLQRLGVMKPKRGVVLSLFRSWARCPDGDGVPLADRVPSGTTLAPHSPVLSMTEWNQMNGLCRAAYWSVAVAAFVPLEEPIAGWAQSVSAIGSFVPPSRNGVLPMSCSYARQAATWVLWLGGYLASSCEAMVFT